ncbi:MAG TPA: hypothetical protein PKJ41_05475 [Bryobacteraceae bacterium]|nr:hypothetical protein [Bryobacteraceae bacterium]
MSTANTAASRPPTPTPIHEHALGQIDFIRTTMERAGSFTAVPGLGGMAMGATAIGAAFLAHNRSAAQGWITTWVAEMVLALAIGLAFMIRKARRDRLPLSSGASRKFMASFPPALLAGAALTWPLYHAGLLDVLASVWLLLYGVAVIAGGVFSARIVPAMGVAFMLLGLGPLVAPQVPRDVYLCAGFGLLHIGFGWRIYRRYGG